MLMSINLPKWLSYIACPNCVAMPSGFRISTIWVESTNLTALYYKEYLGFKIIFRNPMKRNRPMLIMKNRNMVLIKAIDIGKPVNSQRLTLYFSRVDKEYSQLCRKVWLVKPMIDNYFLMKDCNGIEIAYCTN